MEDSSTTDDTLRLYRELREAGHDNVGVVLQAMLRRTHDDIAALADLKPSVRLCKGIYVEPPEVAYQDFDEVRASFVRALEAAARRRLATSGIATHDEWLLDAGTAARRGARARPSTSTSSRCCSAFGPSSGTSSSREGHRLRIYVPFGRHWYEYSLRRLQENPKIAGYIAADTLGRLVGRRNGSLIWARAEGCRVWDADGREYLDLTGGFGVAALGHRNPRVAGGDRDGAGRARARRSRGRGGDAASSAQPCRGRRSSASPVRTRSRSRCARRCSRRGSRASSRSTARTTAPVCSPSRRRGSSASASRSRPGCRDRCTVRATARIPARCPTMPDVVIAEPVQGRAGARVPPDGFLDDVACALRRVRRAARRRCDLRRARPHRGDVAGRGGRRRHLRRQGARRRFAAFGGAVRARGSRAGLGASAPEDVFTHTHVGNPLACAAALVVLEEVPRLLARVREAGERFASAGWHGAGLLRARAGDAQAAERSGVIVIPAGLDGSLISATPPLTITDEEIDEALDRLG